MEKWIGRKEGKKCLEENEPQLKHQSRIPNKLFSIKSLSTYLF